MHPPTGPAEAEIDAAIGACLRDWASPASLQALTDLGPAALTRWIEASTALRQRRPRFAR